MPENEPVRAANAEPYLSTYLNRRGIKLGLPIGGNFELTARCNFNCKMCYVHLDAAEQQRRARELTTDEWLSIASDARDMGTMFLLLTGGEPFIREDFPIIYEALVKMGFVISINTNASLYDDKLRALFIKYPPSRINVTLYGGGEETYSSLCGNASYAKVESALRSMKADGLSVRLNVSITPYNVCDIEKIDALSRELGLHTMASAYMFPPARVSGVAGCNSARFTPEEAGRAIVRWHEMRDGRERFLIRAERLRAGLDEGEGSPDSCVDAASREDTGRGVACRAGRSSFWLTWDGRMTPCGTMDVEASYPLRDGFATAWREVMERTAAIRLPKECTACPMRASCNVCAAVCKCETGSFDKKPEYACIMTQSMARGILAAADDMEKEKVTHE